MCQFNIKTAIAKILTYNIFVINLISKINTLITTNCSAFIEVNLRGHRLEELLYIFYNFLK